VEHYNKSLTSGDVDDDDRDRGEPNLSSASGAFTPFRCFSRDREDVRDFGAAVQTGAGARFDALMSLSLGSRIVNGVVGFGVEAGELGVAETAFTAVLPELLGLVGPGV
jgi:hypothetical protein